MFKIVSGSDFLYGKDNTFTCTLYCQTENGIFPDCQWIDFAKHVFSWWTEEIVRASRLKKTQFTLRFEDGPFWIDCFKDEGSVHMDFKTEKFSVDGFAELCELQEDIPFSEIATELMNAIHYLSSALFGEGHTKDAQETEDVATRIRNAIKSI